MFLLAKRIVGSGDENGSLTWLTPGVIPVTLFSRFLRHPVFTRPTHGSFASPAPNVRGNTEK